MCRHCTWTGAAETPVNHFPFDELFQSARIGCRSLKRGEFLFRNGDPATHLYLVQAGCVRMVRYTREGDVVVMHTAGVGDSLAEASLLSDVHHCDAEAVSCSTVSCFDKKSILATLHGSPEKSMACIALFSRQVRSLRALLEIRAIRSARERVLRYLLMLSDPNTMTVAVAGSVKAMAHDLSMAHETLYRTLGVLEKEGKINRLAGFIQICQCLPPES